MEATLIIMCIIFSLFEISDHNRIRENLKTLFDDEYVPQKYYPSNAASVFLLILSICAAVRYIIQLFVK